MQTAPKKIVNAWAMYDWANSVYNLVITTTFFPIYFMAITKASYGEDSVPFLGEEKEWLFIFCKNTLRHQHFDYFIFGHRHYPLIKQLQNNSCYINLGDWIRNFTYAIMDANEITLQTWQG